MSTSDSRRQKGRAVFLEGSILHHVLRMTAAGAAGLIAIFIVDLLSLVYISWLGEAALTAGIGYASQLSFFIISINVGLLIATGALVSQTIGRGDRAGAERLATSCLIHVVIISALLSLIAMPFARSLLALMGAKGAALDAAVQFSLITLPSTALLAAGMAATGVLRAVGDARRSMYCTLAMAGVASVLDPLFILVMRWDVAGAAWATVVARCCFCIVGLRYVHSQHQMLKPPQWPAMGSDLRAMLKIAIPAIITNLASPVATAWMLRVFSEFGEQIVAGVAMIDRLIPVAFGLLFAMSGAVGPIVGQNYGAKNFARVRLTLTACYQVAA
ncbi:MAG: MATE family efflux transporter, partial [Alphaproteobacteria bacterium]|nr:MATE family efflux transporter [Alphaproteobacteria bacterium]